MNSFETFKHLHKNTSPLLIGNVWDVKSAEIFQANGFRAIGISSQAISNALGYPDGENLPFDELLHITKRITDMVDIPLTVDMEAGYSRDLQGILENVEKLHDCGAVGINLEDTLPGEKRSLVPAASFTETVAKVTGHIKRKKLCLLKQGLVQGKLSCTCYMLYHMRDIQVNQQSLLVQMKR